jgi:SET domain-containing protein
MSMVTNRRVQNHSCDANVEAIMANRSLDWLRDMRGGQLVFITMCDIAAGEELTYHYRPGWRMTEKVSLCPPALYSPR